MQYARLPLPVLGRAALGLIFGMMDCASAEAQPADGTADGRPTVAAAGIDASRAPEIDGDLSDPAWAEATILEDFRQVEPVPGAMPSERTILRIMYDENNLYFAVYAYDSEPEQITVRSMSRDGPLFTGDSISITLDPGLTRRNAYNFEVGPSGGRGDSLVLNNSDELDEWDPIWAARARRVADGWVAEMAIPFRSLSYAEGQPDWGFDFSRNIRRKNEDIRWAHHNPAIDFNDVSQTGNLTGITNINQGNGLDLQIYGLTQIKRDWQIPGEDTGITGTAGANLFYKVTPALTATLTFNPDFSDAPLDARQINTTRFSLFFPETRDFFLQDAAAFEFGGENFGPNNGRPFVTRSIGLARGTPVSIVAGGKISGELAGLGIGAVGAYTGDTPTSRGQFLSALRLARPVLAESRVGLILTHGDPTGVTENTVAGVDFQYRDSNLFGNSILRSDFYYERSFSSTRGHDDSFGVAVDFPNEPWSGSLLFKQVGADFAPALGFANRTGIRLYEMSAGNLTRFRDSRIREISYSMEHNLVSDLRDNLESRESEISMNIETAQDDEFSISFENSFEAVPESFDLPSDIIVPAGRYSWTNINAGFQSSDGRALAAGIEFSCCRFYDGNSIETEVELDYRPNEYFEFSAGWELTMLDMPDGDVDIHVVTANSSVNFTPDMELALQAQWDNISSDFGFLARYRWFLSPVDELFIAFGQAASISGRDLTIQRSQLSVRLGRTIQF